MVDEPLVAAGFLVAVVMVVMLVLASRRARKRKLAGGGRLAEVSDRLAQRRKVEREGLCRRQATSPRPITHHWDEIRQHQEAMGPLDPMAPHDAEHPYFGVAVIDDD